MWRRILGASVLILVILIYVMNEFKYGYILDKGDFTNNIYNFVCYFFVLNLVVSMFIITFYFYKKETPGLKGPKGDLGDRGDQGKDADCDICNVRSNKFIEIPKVDEKDSVITLDNLSDKYDTGKKKKRSRITGLSPRWNIHKNIPIDSKFIGDNSMMCKENKYDSKGSTIFESCENTGMIQSPTYINGAILRVDPSTKDLYSLQYMTNNESKVGDKYVSNTENLNSTKGRWGGKNVIMRLKDESEKIIQGNDRGKYYDFQCQEGSGIYRIDTLHSQPNEKSGNIKGIKFYCKDVKTGKNTKIKTNSGLRKNIHFGTNPNINNNKYVYRRVICDKYKNKPSFISGVGAVHGDKINALNFYNCSYKI